MPEQEPAPITISLSPTQVDSVVRAASHGAPSVAALIAASLARPAHGQGHVNGNARHANAGNGASGPGLAAIDTEDPRLSRSLLRGFSLLAGFGSDGAERGIVELANDLGMSPSTAHRYALTLVELGLLERCPRTRKYRLSAI